MVCSLRCGFLENLLKYFFLEKHIKNLIKSLETYKLNTPNLEKNILKLIKLNIDKKKILQSSS